MEFCIARNAIMRLKDMKISILLAAYNSHELLMNVFIPSLKNCSVDCEVIMRENSDNRMLPNDWVNEKGAKISFKVIGDKSNIGLNKALNECAKAATGDYYYLPHTDMFLMPNWDLSLLQAAKNQPPTSFLMCSRSVEPTQGHTRHHIIKNYGMEASEFSMLSLERDFENYKDSTIEVGARMPFFMHRKLWEKMKGVDENYFSYCTDDDLIQEAWDVGVRKFWMVHDSLVYHLQGKSNNQQKVDKDSDAPYRYFVDKWKKRGYSDASHPGQWHLKLLPFYTKVR
jgi:GT2 family glycosyltransferase